MVAAEGTAILAETAAIEILGLAIVILGQVVVVLHPAIIVLGAAVLAWVPHWWHLEKLLLEIKIIFLSPILTELKPFKSFRRPFWRPYWRPSWIQHDPL